MTNLELKSQVEELVREVDKTHRYSVSRIYGLYNQVFATNETPQTCASCLIRKIKELRTWLANQTPSETPAAEPVAEANPTPAKANKKHINKNK